jgi:hypothetical protein
VSRAVTNDKLSAREAALLAQARAELGRNSKVHAHSAAPLPGGQAAQRDTAPQPDGRSSAGAHPAAPTGSLIQIVTLGGATRAPATDPARRAAAVMAAARAETERLRRRRRRLHVWVPLAFMSAIGLWILLQVWHRL